MIYTFDINDDINRLINDLKTRLKNYVTRS